ncbi:MAG TPA: ion transporter [Rubricoccaceae bacterium]|nr:ion transporter [Rubricoccaceae bacterium]
MTRRPSPVAPDTSPHVDETPLLKEALARETAAASLRRRTWEVLEPARPGDHASRAFDLFILALIALNVLAVVAETVEAVRVRYAAGLAAFEVASVAVFSVEYVLRVWSAVSDPRYRRPVLGRLRFAATPLAVVDLLAVLPFFLPFIGVDLRITRVLRLQRAFRFVKVARYADAHRRLARVLQRKREELVVSLSALVVLLLLASSLMYYVEYETQPAAFSSIPAAMWWAIATLTTVGYGDVYPVTEGGRLLGGLIAVIGAAFVALPAGIVASGLLEVVQEEGGGRRCPHCGGPL